MHGRPGAFSKTVRGIQLANNLGVQVDASCCLTQHNYHWLDELLDQVETLPLQSFTISRMFPIGHGASRNQAEISQQLLTQIYNHLVEDRIPAAKIPIRLTGLLHLPGLVDCERGRSIVGLTPTGSVLPCVLMADQFDSIPHPLEAGLAASVAQLEQHLQENKYRICCDPLNIPEQK